MTRITRKTGSELLRIAIQAGFDTEEEAVLALQRGVRLHWWGMDDDDLSEMLRLLYHYGPVPKSQI